MNLKTCVHPDGRFCYGIHKPAFRVKNLRKTNSPTRLGSTEDGAEIYNEVNLPHHSIEENAADWIFEIPNAFPFKGTTFINRKWTEEKVINPCSISLPAPAEVSLFERFKDQWQQSAVEENDYLEFLKKMPEPLLLSLASTSTDARDLIPLAHLSCRFELDQESHKPLGMIYKVAAGGKPRPYITNRSLFEVVANNPHLPDEYKDVMVLRPGAQGGSEIMGEWERESGSHIFEYLRRNSYIPWGHYAANMANDSVRYAVKDLSFDDMKGLRHLYYQRTLVRLAQELQIGLPVKGESLSEKALESLRLDICKELGSPAKAAGLMFNRTLWGWNFGFDYAPSHYRLHASHQQIHQQFALIPQKLPTWYCGASDNQFCGEWSPFACGDLVESFISDYKTETGKPFFATYIKAIQTNTRMDGRSDLNQKLIVYADEEVILFVPKAQTSQWELQMMTAKPVGNILEADAKTRHALDLGLFIAVNTLSELGASMITSIEYSKRFDAEDSDQRLLYAFLPRLPESPGAFSEAQLRWINGHFPEDFATACQDKLPGIFERLYPS